MAVFMQPIYTQTVSSGVGSVTFNNIPQGFTDLKLVVSSRGASANFTDVLPLAVNGSYNLSSTWMQSYNSGASSDRTVTANTYTTYIREPSSTATANTFSNTELYFPNYTSGSYKSFVINDTAENNSIGNAFVRIGAGLYSNTNPITSLSFTISNGAIVQNSTFSLYGISNVYDTAAPTAPTLGTITDQAGFFSVAFTPAANDRADSYYAYSPASPTSPIYGVESPIAIPVEAQYNYNASIWVAAVNSLGTTQSTTTSAGNVTSNNYASIATVYNSSAGGVNALFTNIPQNYSHLQIRLMGRTVSSSAGAPVYIQFNGDTTNNYSWHYNSGNGSSITAGGLGSYGDIEGMGMVVSGNLANAQCVYIIDLLDYSQTNKVKTLKALGGYDLNGSGTIFQNGGAWNSVSPITSLNVQAYAGFAQYSHIALYGIA